MLISPPQVDYSATLAHRGAGTHPILLLNNRQQKADGVKQEMMLSQSGGRFGPDVPVGWPNRLEMLGYCVWRMVVAWAALQLGRQKL